MVQVIKHSCSTDQCSGVSYHVSSLSQEKMVSLSSIKNTEETKIIRANCRDYRSESSTTGATKTIRSRLRKTLLARVYSRSSFVMMISMVNNTISFSDTTSRHTRAMAGILLNQKYIPPTVSWLCFLSKIPNLRIYCWWPIITH